MSDDYTGDRPMDAGGPPEPTQPGVPGDAPMAEPPAPAAPGTESMPSVEQPPGAEDAGESVPPLGTEGEDGGAKKNPPWFWWAVAGVVIVLLGLFAFFFLQGKNVQVPVVIGLSKAAAEVSITDAGLRVGKVSDVPTITAEPGTVVDQSPRAPMEVPEGTAVDLGVAAVPVVKVPDVVGKTQSEANEEIAVAGLQPGTVTYAYDANTEAGMVISQDPIAGTETTIAAFVALTVSKGEKQSQVPNVVGLSADDARSALEAGGFGVKETKAESKDVPPGDVISQSPAAGTVVSPGSMVTITVSKGVPETPEEPAPPSGSESTTESENPPAESENPPVASAEATQLPEEEPVASEPPSTLTAVPDVVGMGVGDAIGTLKDQELKIRFGFGPDDEMVLKISAQDPAAGTKADRGTAVTLTIGLPAWIFGEPEATPVPAEEEPGTGQAPQPAPAPEPAPTAPSGTPSTTPAPSTSGTTSP
jgi:beta-lactam-binding protein with PASTA domain